MDYTDLNKCIDESDLACLDKVLASTPAMFFESYNGDFESALHYASAYGKQEVLDWFENHFDMPVNLSEQGYETPLGCAATSGNLVAVRWLILHGAKVDGNGSNLISPLMSAVMGGHFEIVKLLVEQGADVNRMHVRQRKLPLDYAKSRGFEEIEHYLKEHGAKGHYIMPERIKDPTAGNGILEYVTLRLDKILPVDVPTPIDVSPCVLKMVPANNTKNSVLFTFGLFSYNVPKIELFLVLPEYWNFYDLDEVNQFPILFLSTLIDKIKKGFNVDEGDYLLAENDTLRELKWPNGISGFFVSDVKWKSNKNLDIVDKGVDKRDAVKLLTLIPLKSTKNGYANLSVEKSRSAGWAKLTLNL